MSGDFGEADVGVASPRTFFNCRSVGFVIGDFFLVNIEVLGLDVVLGNAKVDRSLSKAFDFLLHGLIDRFFAIAGFGDVGVELGGLIYFVLFGDSTNGDGVGGSEFVPGKTKAGKV